MSTQVFLSLIVACSEQSEEPSLAQWNPSFLDFQLSGYLSLLTTLFCLHLLFRPVHRIFYFTVKSDMILFSSHFGPISIPTVPLVRSGAIFFGLILNILKTWNSYWVETITITIGSIYWRHICQAWCDISNLIFTTTMCCKYKEPSFMEVDSVTQTNEHTLPRS